MKIKELVKLILINSLNWDKTNKAKIKVSINFRYITRIILSYIFVFLFVIGYLVVCYLSIICPEMILSIYPIYLILCIILYGVLLFYLLMTALIFRPTHKEKLNYYLKELSNAIKNESGMKININYNRLIYTLKSYYPLQKNITKKEVLFRLYCSLLVVLPLLLPSSKKTLRKDLSTHLEKIANAKDIHELYDKLVSFMRNMSHYKEFKNIKLKYSISNLNDPEKTIKEIKKNFEEKKLKKHLISILSIMNTYPKALYFILTLIICLILFFGNKEKMTEIIINKLFGN